MVTSLEHPAWLKKSSASLKTLDGKSVVVYELVVDYENEAALTAWARHFREHYCLDAQIDMLRKGPKKSRKDYLVDLIFPDKTDDFGPATRSGDFAEILISDLLEYVHGYTVPRTRYGDKKVRNESSKGTDVIGLKMCHGDPDYHSPKDVLIAFEAKAQLKAKLSKNRLQDAIDHSTKDKLRLAESLNSMNRRLIDLGRLSEAALVQRFQEPLGRPFLRKSGAAAIYCKNLFNPSEIASVSSKNHENRSNIRLVVLHSKDMMKLVHDLYARAADEA